MDENFELLEHIYKDCEMAVYTLSTLLETLKDKNNKIKKVTEDILHEYERFLEISKEQLQENGISLSPSSFTARMASHMGIKKEVKDDNSDSSMADMLIKGISMGSIDMEKKIKDYEKEVDKEQLHIAKAFLKFQEASIQKLKEYL